MKISVITVCFNAEKTIEETILSVTNQTYENTEFIIIDGKSTDNTLSIIQKYNKRIATVISEPDKGIYDAMNKGMRLATGDFVIFLGADDHFISFDTLKNVAPYLKERNTIYYGNVFRPIGNDLYCGKFNKYKLAIKNIPHQGMFFPKEVYKNYPYLTKYKIFSDYYNNIILFKKHPFKYINQTIAFFNNTGVSAHGIDKEFNKIKKQTIIAHLGIIPFFISKIYQQLRNLYKKL